MKPRILFLNHTGMLGGAELSLLDVARCYSQSSQVVLFADGAFRERLQQAGVSVEVLRASRSVLGISREGGILQDLRAVPRVLHLAWQASQAAKAYDLLYVNSPKSLVVGALAGKLAGKPIIWHARDMLSADDFSRVHRLLSIVLANNMVTRVIANSRATAEAFVASGGQAERVYIVHNGIDPTPFEAVTLSEVEELRQELGLGEVSTVGVFSRLAPWKGQHILLEALSYMPEVHGVFVGDALFGEQAYAQYLREQTKALGIANRVHFLGFRKDIPQLMQLCDVVVHTSVAAEPFGRVILEGMLARRPVVATRGGGVTEIVEDGVSGVLVPMGDEKTLAKALNDLLADPTKANMLAEEAQSAALRYSLGAMQSGVAQQIREVLSLRQSVKN